MKKLVTILLCSLLLNLVSYNSYGIFSINHTQSAQESQSVLSPLSKKNSLDRSIRKKQNSESISKSGEITRGKNKIVAMVLAAFLGFLGVHRFYMGHTKQGFMQLALTLLGIASFVGGVFLFTILADTITFIGILVMILGFLFLLANAIWITIDFYKIFFDKLEPKGGFDS